VLFDGLPLAFFYFSPWIGKDVHQHHFQLLQLLPRVFLLVQKKIEFGFIFSFDD